ncbi:amidohydrolase family protein [Zhouia sp. PK063]|uniref:amidohydrolase family protein n=1 Tax=Zhouia sp. PK063 TaxID=3373602 RepID=UPI0037B65BF5
MIIDTHVHFWNYHPIKDAWITSDMKAIQNDFLPDDLISTLNENNVAGVIAIQADQSLKETEWLLELAKTYPFIKGVIGWVNLLDKNVDDILKKYASNSVFKGVRHILQAEKEGFMLQPEFLNGIAKLEKYALVYEILVFPNQLEEVISLVSQFPNQQFILDHGAKPQVSKGLNDDWKDNLKALSAFDNVAVKLSGLVTEAETYNSRNINFAPFLKYIYDVFGEDRVMFGSDWPVCLLSCSYKEVKEIVKKFSINSISEQAMTNLWNKNAQHIYKLSKN